MLNFLLNLILIKNAPVTRLPDIMALTNDAAIVDKYSIIATVIVWIQLTRDCYRITVRGNLADSQWFFVVTNQCY